MVTVDGNKNVEITLDKKHVVKDALSRDGSITEKEAEKLVGQKVDILEGYFEEVTEPEETAVVGYALAVLRQRRGRSTAKTFGTDFWYRRRDLYWGAKGMQRQPKKAGKSIGIYLAERAVSQEDLSKIINDCVQKKEILELLKKQPNLWKMRKPEMLLKNPGISTLKICR